MQRQYISATRGIQSYFLLINSLDVTGGIDVDR